MSNFGNYGLDVDANAITHGQDEGGDVDTWADQEHDIYGMELEEYDMAMEWT